MSVCKSSQYYNWHSVFRRILREIATNRVQLDIHFSLGRFLFFGKCENNNLLVNGSYFNLHVNWRKKSKQSFCRLSSKSGRTFSLKRFLWIAFTIRIYIVQCTVTITLMRGKDFDSFKCLYRNVLSIHDAQAHAYGRISVVLLPWLCITHKLYNFYGIYLEVSATKNTIIQVEISK